MSPSLFNFKSFSRSINHIIIMRRYDVITKASQRGYTSGRSHEKPSWASDPNTGYFRPETAGAKENLSPHIEKTSKIQGKMLRGEELWWMPDPHSGYYRPDNFARELDAAELRSLHFNKNHKTT
ncbi:late embryogenesis abundant protein 37 [Capsella rubella]|nr:late embryogenesis abundant protein 37 [Capsella rubella]